MKLRAINGMVAIAIAVGLGTLSAIADETPEKIDPQGVAFFEKHIRPVLTQHCYKCHAQTATKVKGGLLLDTRDGSRLGGETGPAVVPGSVDESLIVSALKHEDFEMPPGNQLPDDVIAKFEQWIEMGAPDPRDGQAEIFGKREINIDEGRKFWAFQPPKKAAPPRVADTSWPRGDIDRFVLAKLEEQKLAPVADASPRELVRRLYFDIIGLPPSPEEVEQWTARLTGNHGIDQVGLAQLVDDLLASPRFGERWGRHWLDIARYADSNGNVDNTPFPQAWRYRNWVIDAFNADMPYDQFITAQLAGDLLPFDSPQQRNAQLVATGFLAIGSKPRPQNNPNFAMDVVAEQIETTTTAMLGLTVACARCHDHKYDPIPTSDYYAMAGIFASSQTHFGYGLRDLSKQVSGNNLISLLPTFDERDPEVREKLERQQELAERKQQLVAELRTHGIDVVAEAQGLNTKQQRQIEERELTRRLRRAQAQLEKATARNNARIISQAKAEIARVKALLAAPKANQRRSPGSGKAVQSLRADFVDVAAKLAALTAQLGNGDHAMGMLEARVADCAICIAGESTDRGPVVPRGVVQVATIGRAPAIDDKHSGRLQLAQWIASENNPLTARVMVNRIWQHLMGHGIVETVDNFGQLGKQPTHPELLDYLAVQLMEDGWSLKQMIRTMTLTRTYQMSSAHEEQNYKRDPDNTWLWRMPPRRLDAEALRDAMLTFSGALDLQRPAPPAMQAEKNRAPNVSTTEMNCRSVYLPIIRGAEPEALALFDFADPSIVVGQREVTTVPSQSLYLLNSPLVIAHSRAAAEKFLTGESSNRGDAERVDYAYLAAFGRRPTAAQRERALEYLRKEAGDQENTGNKNDAKRQLAWATFCQSLIAAAEFRYVD